MSLGRRPHSLPFSFSLVKGAHQTRAPAAPRPSPFPSRGRRSVATARAAVPPLLFLFSLGGRTPPFLSPSFKAKRGDVAPGRRPHSLLYSFTLAQAGAPNTVYPAAPLPSSSRCPRQAQCRQGYGGTPSLPLLFLLRRAHQTPRHPSLHSP